MSQNTIVERASAELSKRINGLRKHSSSNASSGTVNNNSSSTIAVGKTSSSVMERVTNVFCGGSSSNNNNINNTSSNASNNNAQITTTIVSINTPEKPYRHQSNKHNSIFSHHNKMSGNNTSATILSSNSNQATPQTHRKYHTKPQVVTKRFNTPIITIEQLFLDEKFLQQFFFYFSSFERRELAQVCAVWRDVLYRNPSFYNGLVPVLQCREMRATSSQDKVKLYNSIIRRGFHSIALNGATDECALDIVHSFPLASKHIHSLSLRCSSISDRGLEALLDHLQVISMIFTN